MSKQVFRTLPRSSLSGSLVAHLQGQSRPDTARSRDDGADVVVLDAQGEPTTPALAEQALKDARAWAHASERRRKDRNKHGGRPPKLFRDSLFAGPRTADRAVAMAFARDCVKWINGVYGAGSPMATASVHLDEAVTHVHVTHAVGDPDGLPGWGAVERASRVGGGKLRGRFFLAALHDDFHERVGSRYGLERGARGSRARHEPIDRSQSESSRVKVLEADLAKARFAAREARTELRGAIGTIHAWYDRNEATFRELFRVRCERDEARKLGAELRRERDGYRAQAKRAERDLAARPAARARPSAPAR